MEKYQILTKTPTIPRLDEKTILQKALLVPLRRMVTRKSFCRVRQVNVPKNPSCHKQFQQGFEFAEKR